MDGGPAQAAKLVPALTSESGKHSPLEHTTMIIVSQSAIESVLSDIRSGDTSYVDDFFAARPDWQDKTTEQADKQQEEQTTEPVQA
jgi:hypothetical protein